MRERLDCAVLMTRCTVDWVEPLLGQYAGGRLYLHGLDAVMDIDEEGSTRVLGALAMALRRYDACLLPVWPATLSWARVTLLQGVTQLHTPVLALVRDLTAAGLFDLHELGVSDFVRYPLCSHEIRLRIERLLNDRRAFHGALGSSHLLAEAASQAEPYGGAGSPAAGLAGTVVGPEWDLESYAVAAASRCSRTSESFQDAKKHVVQRFERAYINAALGRHGGNIAMAARSAKKHRRAFWALMRKHSIDAGPFRSHGAVLELGNIVSAGSKNPPHSAQGKEGDCRPSTRLEARPGPQGAGKGKIG